MKLWFAAGALSAAFSVILGAFAAHGLKGQISDANMEVFRTGVQYHQIHSIAILIASGLTWLNEARARTACFLFMQGTLLFSVSLYVLAVTDMKWLGAIAPLGGLSFITGWLALASAVQKPNDRT